MTENYTKPPTLTLLSQKGSGDTLSPFYKGKTENNVQETKWAKKRHRVANELLGTEEDYVGNLKVLLEVYRVNLRSVLADDLVDAIFLHLDTILKYNSMLLSELQGTIMRSKFDINNTVLGDIIAQLSKFLYSYAPFITHFSRANDMIAKAKRKESVRRCLESCQGNPRCKGRDIFDLLIMPVQRLPRYGLLLTELLEATPPGHVDHDPLTKALLKIKAVADKVNLRRQESEDYQMLQGMKIVNATLDLTKGKRAMLKDNRIIVEMKKGSSEPMQLLFFSDVVLFGHLHKGNRFDVHQHFFLQELLPLGPQFAVNGHLCIALEQESVDHQANAIRHSSSLSAGDLTPTMDIIAVTLQVGHMRKFACQVPFDCALQELSDLLEARLGTGACVSSIMMGAAELIPSHTLVQAGVARPGVSQQTLRFVVDINDFREYSRSMLSRIAVQEIVEVQANPHSAPTQQRRRASIVSKFSDDSGMFCFRSFDGEEVNKELFELLNKCIKECRASPVDLAVYRVASANTSAVDELAVKKDDSLKSLGKAIKEKLVSPGRKAISRLRRLSGSHSHEKKHGDDVMTHEEMLLLQSCLSGLRDWEEPVSH